MEVVLWQESCPLKVKMVDVLLRLGNLKVQEDACPTAATSSGSGALAGILSILVDSDGS